MYTLINIAGIQISNKGMMIISKHSPSLKYLTLSKYCLN